VSGLRTSLKGPDLKEKPSRRSGSLFEVFAPAEIDPRRNLTPAIYLAFFVSFAFVRRNGFPVEMRTHANSGGRHEGSER